MRKCRRFHVCEVKNCPNVKPSDIEKLEACMRVNLKHVEEENRLNMMYDAAKERDSYDAKGIGYDKRELMDMKTPTK